MLYDNIFDRLDPYQSLQPRPAQPVGQQPLRPLSPAEEDSLLAKIGHGSLSTLGYVGSMLEKATGARAVRGLLGGHPRELASIIPFSDASGLTDERDRVSGKDLLGLTGDDWGSTLAGIGAEIATDPALYLSFGGSALTKAGTVASKLGSLPGSVAGRATTTLGHVLQGAPTLQPAAETAAGGARALAPLLSQPLGGVAKVGIPFTPFQTVLGTGQAGADFMSGLGKVGGALDTVARKVPVAGHIYGGVAHGLDATRRYGAALLDPEVVGAITREGQAAARQASATSKRLIAEDRGRVADWATQLEQGGRGAAQGDPLGAALRQTGEGVLPPGVAPNPVDVSVAGEMQQALGDRLAQLKNVGKDVGELQDPYARYLPRQKVDPNKPGLGGGGSRPVQPNVARDFRIEGRDPIFKGLPAGTEGLNQLAVDPLVHQGGHLQAEAHVLANYLGGVEQVPGQAAKLVDYAHSLPPEFAEAAASGSPLRLFGNHPLRDYLTQSERSARLLGAADASHNLLAQGALDAAAGPLPAGARPILDVLKDAGLDFNVISGSGGAGAGAQHTLLQNLAARGMGGANLSNLYVPAEIAGEVTRFHRGFTNPESLNPIMRLFDQTTGFTKALQTALWPGFHVRNLVAGMWQNLVKGGFEPGLDPVSGFIKPVLDTRRLLGGGVLADANKISGLEHLKPAEATAELGREMFAQRISGHAGIQSRELAGTQGVAQLPGTTLQDILSGIPNQTERTLGGALSPLANGWGDGGWNPLNVAGVGSSTDKFAPVAAGRQVGDLVSGLHRGSLYMALRRQGYLPEEAGRQVLQAHFDYSAATPFEKSWMKRLVPFYTFTRNNIPFELEQLAQRPGGLVAQSARVANDLRQEDQGFRPESLGGGLAIPLGPEEGGTKRYLKTLGLPPEEAFSFLHGGPKAGQEALMGVLSQANPLLKGPLEYATGKQFFSGRELADVPTQTGTTLADEAIMNSPLARLAGTYHTLTDERKGLGVQALNLLTGAKISDVDLDKQRSIAAREYIADTLRGQPGIGHFETIYPKPGAPLSPGEVELLRLNRTLEQRAQQEALRKKKIRVGG